MIIVLVFLVTKVSAFCLPSNSSTLTIGQPYGKLYGCITVLFILNYNFDSHLCGYFGEYEMYQFLSISFFFFVKCTSHSKRINNTKTASVLN